MKISHSAVERKERRRERKPGVFVDDLVENVMLHTALSERQPGVHPREPAEFMHHMLRNGRPDSHQHLNIL